MAESDHMRKKSSTIQNISFNIVHLVIISKIIYIFVICSQSSTKVFSTTGTPYCWTGSSVKLISEVTFVGKYQRLVYT